MPEQVSAFPAFIGNVAREGNLMRMLDALGSEYPELSGHAILAALDAATTAAGTMEGTGKAAEARRHLVLTLARDRLDVARERAAAATRRVARGIPDVDHGYRRTA